MANYYNKDLYKILDIDRSASSEEVKKAYKKLVKIYHPDAAGPNANAAKFKEIQEAYEILSDKDKRNKYDVLRGYYREKIQKEYEKKTETRQNKYDEYVKKVRRKINNQQEEDFSQSINEALDSLFHSKQKRKYEQERLTPKNGEDINIDVTLTLDEALNGTNRKVNILHTEPCPNCLGHKFINGAQCKMCSGTGQTSIQKKLNVKIPKGVSQGSKVRIKKEGNKGLNGGKDGDLFLIINIEKDTAFETDGLNILYNLPVSVTEAVFGADISLKLPTGNINFKLPAMTSSMQKFRLTGMGLSDKSRNKTGDAVITISIKLPKTLPQREKDLYLKLKEISDYNPRKDT